MLTDLYLAKTALQNSKMFNGISKKIFLYMFDVHKNNFNFCRELIANKNKLPERLSLK
jgi:hypothetical protein